MLSLPPRRPRSRRWAPGPAAAAAAGRVWLKDVVCQGDEELLSECHMLPGTFLDGGSLASAEGCDESEHRLVVACRQFAVNEEEQELLDSALAPGVPYPCAPLSNNLPLWHLHHS
eukprot:jgi/Ulvmu1/11556/UM078_0049.1